jgi:transposase InsO family protein
LFARRPDRYDRRGLLDESIGQCLGQRRVESFFSSLKTKRTARKLYRTRDEAKADVFDDSDGFYNLKRRHSRIGYMSPMEFESRQLTTWP